MFIISIAIVVAYLSLILISIFWDLKKKAIRSERKYSIYHMLIFATAKMVIAIAVVVAGASIAGFSGWSVLGLSNLSVSTKTVAYGLVAGVGFAAIYIVWQQIAAQLSPKRGEAESVRNIVEALPQEWLPLIRTFALISLEAGLLEEIFFRGIMQTNILHYSAPVWAIVVAGLFFGFAHFYQGVSGIVGTSLLGIWLGTTFAFTGNLFVPIIGHFLGDFTCMMLSSKQIIQRNKRMT